MPPLTSFDDDGISYSLNSEASLDSNSKAKLKSILDRLVGIDNRLKESLRFQEMVEDDLDYLHDTNPNYVEGIFFIRRKTLRELFCCRPPKQKQKIKVYDARSLFIFHHDTTFRRFIVQIVESKVFQNFILLVIMCTTITLMLQDFSDRDSNTKWNQNIEKLFEVFNYIYFAEFLLKIVAMGAVLHKNSYFREPWNWLDFTVVVVGILEVTPLPNLQIKAIRSLRVLRPLRSINALPSMKKLVTGLINSIPSLLNAILFMSFIFMQFAIFGTEQFGGAYHNQCRVTRKPINGSWQIDFKVDRLCSSDGSGQYQCEQDQVCGDPVSVGIRSTVDDLTKQSFIDYGITSFDNILWSTATIFQCVTQSGWSTIMYNLNDTNKPYIVVIFFILLQIIGAFLLLNVVLAVLANALERSDIVQAEVETKKKLATAISVNRMQRRLKNLKLEFFNRKLSSVIIQEDKPSLQIQQVKSRNQSRNLMSTPNLPEQTGDQTIFEEQKVENTENSQKISDSSIAGDDQKNEPFPELQTPENQTQQNLVESNAELDRQTTIVIKTKIQKDYFCLTFYQICNSPLFTLLITLLILTNTVVLAMDRYPISKKQSQVQDLLNQVFSWFFVAEMLVKLGGMGIKHYARDTFNLFDALLVILSLVEMVLQFFGKSSFGGALIAFRGIRLLRVFKLARSWSSFRILLGKILDTFDEIFTFAILLGIFMIVFMILGLEFFANTVHLDANNNIVESGQSPLINMDNLQNAFVTVFQNLIGNGWNQVMYPFYRSQGVVAILYFDISIIVLNIILLKLFLALLLAKFSNPTERVDHDYDTTGLENLKLKTEKLLSRVYEQLNASLQKRFQKWFNLSSRQIKTLKVMSEKEAINRLTKLDTMNKRVAEQVIDRGNKVFLLKDLQKIDTISAGKISSSISQIVRSDVDYQKKSSNRKSLMLEGRSLYFLSADNFLRIKCAQLITLQHFENFSISLILISTVLLALDNPLDDPASAKQRVLTIIDLVLTALFTFEACVKIIVFGFLCNGHKSYLRLGWNVIDFTVVVFSLASLLPVNINFQFYKILRLMRLLRPLRFIQKNPGLKIAVQSLINALPGIFNLSLISMMMISMFAILGVNFFKGTFYNCSIDNIPAGMQTNIYNQWDCLDYGGEWNNSDSNFDDIGQALKSMFQLMTSENWTDLLFSSMASTNQNQMPKPNSKPLCIIYYVFALLIGSQFIINMFVSVVISTFFREKETLNRNTLLTKLEHDYIDACMQCYSVSPIRRYQSKGNKVKDKMHEIAVSRNFENVIFVCICFNITLLTFSWYGNSQNQIKVIDTFNKSFIGVYILEFIIKILAFGIAYFREGWNLLDFSVVMAAVIELLLAEFSNHNGSATLAIIRCFRIVRVTKLIRNFKEMRRFLMTFFGSLPALINVGSLLFLFLYIYAVLGMNLFATIKLQSNLNEKANFQSFGLSLLTLFRSSTGENWNYLMNDAARSRSINFTCVQTQTYEDRVTNGVQGCGSPALSNLYFISFQLYVTFILLNLFIAIILEAFSKQLQDEEQQIQPETIEEFVLLWQKYDPGASGMINIDDLENLVFDMVDRELFIKNQKPNQRLKQAFEVLFNFHHIKMLRLASSWRRKETDGSKEYQDLEKSLFFQRQLARQVNQLIGEMCIPTYDKLQHYNFYDVLIGFIKFTFSLKHKEQFQIRQQRIQNFRATGQELEYFDRISKDSDEYETLNEIQKQIFNEINTSNFQHVVHNIEMKVIPTNPKQQIRKLNEMTELRRKHVLKNAKRLDNFGEIAIDSSLVFGARVIQRFLIHRREKLDQRNKRRAVIFKLPDLSQLVQSKKDQSLQRQALLDYKQMLRSDIKARLRGDEQRRRVGNLIFDTSSSSSSSSSHESRKVKSNFEEVQDCVESDYNLQLVSENSKSSKSLSNVDQRQQLQRKRRKVTETKSFQSVPTHLLQQLDLGVIRNLEEPGLRIAPQQSAHIVDDVLFLNENKPLKILRRNRTATVNALIADNGNEEVDLKNPVFKETPKFQRQKSKSKCPEHLYLTSEADLTPSSVEISSECSKSIGLGKTDLAPVLDSRERIEALFLNSPK